MTTAFRNGSSCLLKVYSCNSIIFKYVLKLYVVRKIQYLKILSTETIVPSPGHLLFTSRNRFSPLRFQRFSTLISSNNKALNFNIQSELIKFDLKLGITVFHRQSQMQSQTELLQAEHFYCTECFHNL